MFVSNVYATDRITDLNILAYTDTETSTKYYVGLNSDEVPHYAGKVLPYELTYLINNENSVVRKFYIDDMTVETGPADWCIYAGYLNDKIYVYYGNEEIGCVVPYEYNTSTRVMSYAYNSADPTQPTQPTEPVQQPNTGTYLPLIGVMLLAMFGMVFIYCRKTMF